MSNIYYNPFIYLGKMPEDLIGLTSTEVILPMTSATMRIPDHERLFNPKTYKNKQEINKNHHNHLLMLNSRTRKSARFG